MGNHSYQRGVDAGTNGSKPSPPEHNVIDSLTGVSAKDVEKWADDYKSGYLAGAVIRAADVASDGKTK